MGEDAETVGVDEEVIPEGVYWSDSDKLFRNADGKSMGAKFFDKWKERRGDFPNQPSPVRPRRRTEVRPEFKPRSEPTNSKPVSSDVQDQRMRVAHERHQWFLAYIAVGFTREEAFELCVRS